MHSFRLELAKLASENKPSRTVHNYSVEPHEMIEMVKSAMLESAKAGETATMITSSINNNERYRSNLLKAVVKVCNDNYIDCNIVRDDNIEGLEIEVHWGEYELN